MKLNKTENLDLIDELLEDWKRERPELDATAMMVVGRILNIGRILEKKANEALKGYNIHYTDLDVLATLRRSGTPYRLTPTQLRNFVLITSGAMTALLDRLERKKLISRSLDPEDGRIKMVNLTENGRLLIDKAIVTRFEEADSVLKSFKTKEVEQFSQLLRKLSIAIENPT
ncbi:MAG: MarR family transcriptional regulator [Flammeovirgaceae bacterium]|nr:MarR family transcriptional regulator [Flammeovirgaceae bacterium]